MNKKIIQYILGIILVGNLLTPLTSFATPKECINDPNNPGGCLITPIATGSGLENLPKGNIFTTTIRGIIKVILLTTGFLFFAGTVVSGVLMIISRGKEEDLKRAKDALIHCVFGLIIIAGAYAIVFGALVLDYFEPAP